jgi:predicted TIM-barrel fold metal-dependent hydrolase
MATAAPERLAGRLLDADAHLYLEPEVMEALLEPIGRDWVIEMLEAYKRSDTFAADRLRGLDDVWGVKGLAAHGACEPEVRVETMDRMGIARQLAFPNTLGREAQHDTPEARQVLRNYNDYCLEWTRRTGGRSIGVCSLNLRSHEQAMTEARRVVDAGAKALVLGVSSPPGGVSLAHPIWDELWALASDAGVPVTMHIGSAGQFSGAADDPILMPRALWDSPTLRSAFPDRPGSEERIGPIWTIIAPIPVEILLTSMVMGGVFERFPELRLGIIEFGAQWVGPLAERMDLHADLLAKVDAALPLKPSEYLTRNVRVTPFWSEPVGRYVERYGMEELYVFSTDFPHVEGGRDPIGKFLASVAPLGDAAVDAFFAENARLLFA